LVHQSLTRLGANTLAVDASAENIHIATYHAAADPRLASLSYRHALAETLVQEPKRFDVVCSMEVIEHVDNPAEFLRSCAELVKVCPLSPHSHRNSLFTFCRLLSIYLAWRTSFPLDRRADAALIPPHHRSSRKAVPPRRAGHAHLFQIHQPGRASRLLRQAARTRRPSVDFAYVCARATHTCGG